MHDKVPAMVRETLIHENTFEKIDVDLSIGQVWLTLSQPNERSSWPDHELVLTFQDIHYFVVRSIDAGVPAVEMLLGMECSLVHGRYHAEISVGNAGLSKWFPGLNFGTLNDHRS